MKKQAGKKERRGKQGGNRIEGRRREIGVNYIITPKTNIAEMIDFNMLHAAPLGWKLLQKSCRGQNIL